MKRRKFLKASGAGIAATGLAGILAAHRAPVFAQANTVHILRWNDFVPAADKVLREVYVPEVQKALGVKLNVETVNANDIQARATAGDPVGQRPRHIHGLNNQPQLYADSVAEDVERRRRRGRQGAGRHLRLAEGHRARSAEVDGGALVDGARR